MSMIELKEGTDFEFRIVVQDVADSDGQDITFSDGHLNVVRVKAGTKINLREVYNKIEFVIKTKENNVLLTKSWTAATDTTAEIKDGIEIVNTFSGENSDVNQVAVGSFVVKVSHEDNLASNVVPYLGQFIFTDKNNKIYKPPFISIRIIS